MAEYIQHSQDIITSLQAENAELRKTASHEKTASASPIDQDSLENMVDNVIEAGILKEADRQQAIDAVNADPNSLVNFVDRLATRTTSEKTASAVRPLGRPQATDNGTQKTASRESDAHFDDLCSRLRNR
jgi:hypothetical protein